MNGSFVSGGFYGALDALYRRRTMAVFPSSSDAGADRSRCDSCGSSPGFTDYEWLDNSANNSLNSQSSWFPILHEESDEDRFRRIYPTLHDECKFFKLLLPPKCELMEDSIASKLRQQHEKQLAEVAKQQKQLQKHDHNDASNANNRGLVVDEADDPVQRMQMYFRHFMVLVRSLFAYDLVGAAWTILLWFQGIRKHRRTHSRGVDVNAVVNDMNLSHTCDDDCGGGDEKEEEFQDESRELQQTPLSGTTQASTEVNSETPEQPQEEELSPEAEANSRSVCGVSVDEETVWHETPTPVDAEQETANDKGLDGFVVDAVSFLHGHLTNFVDNVMKGDESENKPADTTVADTTTADTTTADTTTADTTTTDAEPCRGAELATTEMARSVSNAATTDTAKLRHDDLNLFDDDIDTDSINQSAHPQVTSNEETATVFSAESKLRSASWFFFESANSEESLKRMSLEVPVPDKNGYILGDEYLHDERCTPLLVFVNSRSGPQQGHLLITQLRRLLNPIQVWDLAHGRPEPVLESFCVMTRLRILVCGGDGTVSWIISALDSLNLKRKWPPIAILPLGTGNDLARVHGWGAGYNNESLITILEQISESYIYVLDRWELTVEHGKKRVTKNKNFLNYFSIGVDAETALQVHYLRERRPEWFFSRLVNKAWYGVMSAEEHIKGNSVNVQREIILYADGVRVPLPADAQGIIVLNIDSYAGGVPLWSHGVKEGPLRRCLSMGASGYGVGKSFARTGSSDDLPEVPLTEAEIFERVTACDLPASCQDGCLDIVTVRGLAHLGQCKVGIGHAQRLCQCREVKIVVKKKVAMQIDGEPWRQEKCVVRIKRKRDPALMLHRSADDGGIETEMSKLLEWAEERQLIDRHVHSVLMKEFSRRIETKTRQRRVRSKEHNVIENLRRAIGSTGAISSLGGGGGGIGVRIASSACSSSHKQHHHHQQFASLQHFQRTEENEAELQETPLQWLGSRPNAPWGTNNFSNNEGIAF